MIKEDGETDFLSIKTTSKYLKQMNGEHVISSYKISGRDGKRKKYNAELIVTDQTLFIFKKRKVFEFKSLEQLSFIIYCEQANEFILQFSKEASLRIFSVEHRDDIIRCLINRFGALLKKPTQLFFVKEMNLHRFFTTDVMLEDGLEVTMDDLSFELMNLEDFNNYLSSSSGKKDEEELEAQRTRSIWHKSGNEHLRLEDFKVLKLLGRGGFGKVALCQNSIDGSLHAMKILDKKNLVENDQVEHTKTEKDILALVNHQFLVSMECAYMDKTRLYFIMELMRGGELYSHHAKKRRFNEKTVKFFAACVVLGLGHLHSNHYVYRDLKLENILMNKNGYLKLADFGLAKYMREKSKTHTLCGTLYYLAPEVITKEGHSYPVDWWSLGIVIFELMCGCPPFYPKSKNTRVLMNIIKRGNLIFPESIQMSSDCKNLITGLLKKKPHERLGYQAGSLEVMDHPWFEDIDWSALMAQTMEPPYTPKIKDNDWINNFDAQYTNVVGKLLFIRKNFPYQFQILIVHGFMSWIVRRMGMIILINISKILIILISINNNRFNFNLDSPIQQKWGFFLEK